jgi:kumamolisin
MRGAKAVGPAPANERFEVTVRVRPRKDLPSLAELTTRRDQPPLTHAEYENEYGARPDDLAKVAAFAAEHGLQVVESSIPRRLVILSGTAAQFSDAFEVRLDHYQYPKGTYRGRTGPVHIPEDLQNIVVGVFGLDNRPFARPHFRSLPKDSPAAAQAMTFDPPQVARLYNFPTDVDGSGQCIGIIELGGGFLQSDLDTFFGNLGLAMPSIKVVPVDGGKNQVGGDADGEVALDIQVAGAVAPGAKIAVYFAPNDPSGKGFLDALTQAINDTDNNPSVISISWGGPDEDPTDNFLTQFNDALKAAALLKITVCTAAGDNGAADETPRTDQGQPNWDGQVHVDFPSASPFALACGGTRLVATNASTIKSEAVWNQGHALFDSSTGQAGTFGATGGGVSTAFDLADYQAHAGVPVSLNGGGKGRGVPDVAGVADPATGFNIILGGQSLQGIGGTSAVAPLWAGLIALINQKKGSRVGFINPTIYALPAGSPAFHDVISGNNHVSFEAHPNIGYDAKTGWDPCTGLGSPNGVELAKVL